MKKTDGRTIDPKAMEEIRVRAVQRVQEGESPETIIKTLGFSRGCIYNWLARYRSGGWHALKSGYSSGRPKKLTAKQIKWVYKTIKDKDPQQLKFEFALWTRKMVATLIKCQFGLKLSPVSVGRLLHQLGFSCQKPLYRAYQRDPELVEKWKAEGRYEQEVAELDAFFERTGYPRAPRFYIIKWLTDYIVEYGIDGYRCDTVKHTEEYVWQEFKTECDYAFSQWKEKNPDKVLDDNPFYLVGEVYNYNISSGKYFDFGDKKVNYFDESFHSLINFEFKSNAKGNYEQIFSKYSEILKGDLKGFGTLNYLSSHDDGSPFDANRRQPYAAATKLLLSPGTSQIYYGDESARPLKVEGADGDANMRSFMNWEAIENDPKTQNVLKHWQKLGQFRANHPAIGAGTHQMITQTPYVFYRSFYKGAYEDLVVVGLNLRKGTKTMDVSKIFKDGEILRDAYSNQEIKVINGKAEVNSGFNIVLLERTDE